MASLVGEHPFHRRDEWLWLNLLAYPLAAYWLPIGSFRWWLGSRDGTAANDHLAAIVIGTLWSTILVTVAVLGTWLAPPLRHNLTGGLLGVAAFAVWHRETRTPIPSLLASSPDQGAEVA